MKKELSRRDFLKSAGLIGLGAGTLLSTVPWMEALADENTKKTIGEKVRIGIIGPGSRGRFLMNLIKKNPKAEMVAICDIYQPSVDKALKIAPKAKVYNDYRKLLEDKEVDAVVIATPLYLHYQMAMDSLDAGKDLFCEKSLSYTIAQCYDVYQKYKSTGRIFFVGQQRLFDPRYLKAMEMIHSGMFGEIQAVRAFWFRNGSWRNNVPDPSLERQLNWRLYKEYSRGLMTELGGHLLQVGTWAMQKLPETVMGAGGLTYWKDGREVDDNVSCIFSMDDGRRITYESVISNKFYGLEEQIMGNLGTVEPEKGMYYFEDGTVNGVTPKPAAGFMQMMKDVQNQVFEKLPFAGTSWEPEVAKDVKGNYIMGEDYKINTDGSQELINAFVEAVITQKQPERIAEECYYASAMVLLGYDAIEQGKKLTFPHEYRLNYLNHKHQAK